MSTATSLKLDPHDVSAWAAEPFQLLFRHSRLSLEALQLEALTQRFERLPPAVSALDALASRQGINRVESFEGAAPLLFDHRVYKSYPVSLIEKRQFDRLTAWLRRLTTHDLTAVPLYGVRSVGSWLERLDEHGMIMLHSTGTTGKLSFLPRSRQEWQGEEGRHVLYDYAISSDLLSLAARLRTAEERGEVDKLDLDPQLLEERAKLIEAGRRRDHDLELWFTKLAKEFRGQRVRIDGVTADLVRLALKGRAEGIECEFAPGSVLFTSGGLKGLRDAPDDWEQLLKDFFGIDRLCSIYGMTECMGTAPLCSAGYYHFFPYTIPLLLDADGNVLPREAVQTGRLAFFDLLAESYWGGFIAGDRITIYWDDDCECGWKSPRLDRNIARFSELEGGDDKISCAGTEEAYSEFMDYVSRI
jgi:hypothetical protein